MRHRARAGNAVTRFARIGLEPANQFGQRPRARLRSGGDGEIQRHEARYGREIVERVVGKVRINRWMGDDRPEGREQQGSPIRRRGLHRAQTDAAIAARPVFDNRGFVEGDANAFSQNAHQSRQAIS